MFLDPEVSYFYNYNVTSILTPVDVNRYKQLLIASNYDTEATRMLIQDFSEGFDLGYRGPYRRQDQSRNLPFQDGVGDKFVLWEKVMKEVREGRYAGRFRDIPYKFYAQSPIGLVPKGHDGFQTRLIFHLSYDFPKGAKSFNFYTPADQCKVKYNDLDHAIKGCLQLLQKFPHRNIWTAISDVKSAFRILPTHRRFWLLLMMMARDPKTGIRMYFLDKNLPFGSCMSCKLFQNFSNSLVHIFKFLLGR